MKVRATIGFTGSIAMFRGEQRDVPEDIAAPLLECGYLTACEECEGETSERLDEDALKKMKRADLNALAAEMGIEAPSKYKTIADLAAAVAAIKKTEKEG